MIVHVGRDNPLLFAVETVAHRITTPLLNTLMNCVNKVTKQIRYSYVYYMQYRLRSVYIRVITGSAIILF